MRLLLLHVHCIMVYLSVAKLSFTELVRISY